MSNIKFDQIFHNNIAINQLTLVEVSEISFCAILKAIFLFFPMFYIISLLSVQLIYNFQCCFLIAQ